MAKNFNELFSKLRENGMKKVSVAVAQDEPVLEAVREAKELGIAEAVLVGNEEKIKEAYEICKNKLCKKYEDRIFKLENLRSLFYKLLLFIFT